MSCPWPQSLTNFWITKPNWPSTCGLNRDSSVIFCHSAVEVQNNTVIPCLWQVLDSLVCSRESCPHEGQVLTEVVMFRAFLLHADIQINADRCGSSAKSTGPWHWIDCKVPGNCTCVFIGLSFRTPNPTKNIQYNI